MNWYYEATIIDPNTNKIYGSYVYNMSIHNLDNIVSDDPENDEYTKEKHLQFFKKKCFRNAFPEMKKDGVSKFTYRLRKISYKEVSKNFDSITFINDIKTEKLSRPKGGNQAFTGGKLTFNKMLDNIRTKLEESDYGDFDNTIEKHRIDEK